MRYVDEFRRASLVDRVAQGIHKIAPKENLNIMEVCGTHTQNFFRFGLDKLLPQNLHFISGPGCPVCVSHQEYMDQAIAYTQDKNIILVTFGDMLRVPGTRSSLEKERAKRGNVFVVYSALDALTFARRYPHKKVVFLAVGFETTASTIALSIRQSGKEKLNNLFFFSSLKTIPQAMQYLVQDKRLNLSGFLCPGHVSTIIGTRPYDFIPQRYGVGCCIAGFEPLDILEGIYFLLRQILKKTPRVENQYKRAVTRNGNLKAQKIISQVFEQNDAYWRGLGRIPKSGLKIKNKFSQFDAQKMLPLRVNPAVPTRKQKKCHCAEVIKGLINPDDCALFKKICSPENPYGPCMVSAEGTCHSYYKYKKNA
jgi:hydrogenase expression/formation protein HypD